MIIQAESWLHDQLSQKRELLLIIDRLAEPDPISALFAADLMHSYVNLYLGTEFTDLADSGPWLIHLAETNAAALHALLETPQQHWGWLASVEHMDLPTLAKHWQARMLIDDNGKRALYRFQDNRVIAHHLKELSEQQRPLLMGPLDSVLCWDEHDWISIDNPRPDYYPAPFESPWLAIAEPDSVAEQIQRHNLERWLWETHPTATAQLAETQPLLAWLDTQLATAKNWQWHSLESVQFLLQQHLEPALIANRFWAVREGETPDAHFVRCQREFTAAALQVTARSTQE